MWLLIYLIGRSDLNESIFIGHKNKNYFENFITRSVKSSNAIEGNTLSYAEIYSIIFVDESLPVQSVNPKKLYEAINLKYAISYSLKVLILYYLIQNMYQIIWVS